jgi:hypothetical protein
VCAYGGLYCYQVRWKRMATGEESGLKEEKGFDSCVPRFSRRRYALQRRLELLLPGTRGKIARYGDFTASTLLPFSRPTPSLRPRRRSPRTGPLSSSHRLPLSLYQPSVLSSARPHSPSPSPRPSTCPHLSPSPTRPLTPGRP